MSRVACFVVLATLLPARLPAGQVYEDVRDAVTAYLCAQPIPSLIPVKL
ncbi:MAG: hypothetical protein ACUVXB_18190 [Bryobacteraceae bacterium]